MFIFIAFLLISFFVYVPVILNPSIFLARGNDLTEFFLPIILYVKKVFLAYHTIPLWRPYSLGGMPLVGDPQSQIFYLPNIIFLFTSLNFATIIFLLLHSAISGLAVYKIAKQMLKLSSPVSFICAFVWIAHSKLFTYMEAGHLGLITGWTWIPVAIYSAFGVITTKKARFAVFLSLSLSFLFHSHVFVFLIMGILLVLFALYKRAKVMKSRLLSFVSIALLTFSLITPSLLPQFEWIPKTTRQVLVSSPDVYPHWAGKREFLSAILWPLSLNIRSLWQMDTEKWITLGIMPLIFAFLGLRRSKTRTKLFIGVVFFVILLVAANNLSPLYPLLIKFNWYKTLRVSTRFWFVVILGSILLVGYWLESIWQNGRGKKIFVFLATAMLIECIFLSWTRITKPISRQPDIPLTLYEFFEKDQQKYKIFCINRCIPTLSAVEHDLELIDGYATLIDLDYYQKFKKMTGSSWDYYSLSLPPFGTYLFEQIQPNPEILAELKTKYIVSPHQLKNNKFEFIDQFGPYYIYKNSLFVPYKEEPKFNPESFWVGLKISLILFPISLIVLYLAYN